MPDQKTKLTDILVRSVKPPESGRITIIDTEVSGLSLRVSATGAKSWFVRYRPKKQTQRSVAIPGDYPTTSLAAARSRAQDILAAAKRGVDLIEEEKRQLTSVAKAVATKQRTVRTVIADHVEMHCKKHLKRWRDAELRLKNHVLPTLGDKPIADVRRGDIVELLDHLEHKKGLRHQVNRVRTSLGGVFRWAVEREYLAENPIIGTRSRKMESERTRVLDDRELEALWRALDDMPDPGRALVRILLLTAVRRDEARQMKWDELDLDTGVWLLPAARTKTGRDYEVMLSKEAIEVFKSIERKGPQVFTVNQDGKIYWGGHGPFKAELDKRCGVTGWVLHDLRRTVRSRLSELRVPYEVAERVINHAISKVERTYNRHAYREEKAAAVQAWADRLMIIVGEASTTNVFPMRASR